MIKPYARPPIRGIPVIPPIPPEVALIFGGSEKVYEEYAAALALCQSAGVPTKSFVTNSALEVFPGEIDYGVTLHPEKLGGWLSKRMAAGLPAPKVVWGHRPATNVQKHTRDWGGSVSMFAVKVARQEAFVKIILCGCPMTVEDGHFLRHERWNAATAFQRGWRERGDKLGRPCIRSMSGWTLQQFGAPTDEWLKSNTDRPAMVHKGYSIKA